MTTEIFVARDISYYPGGRTGENYGEQLRWLIQPIVERGERLVVRLDGTLGYSAAFLEAAFGDLVRETGMCYEEFKSRVDIISIDPYFQFYCDMSYKFADSAANGKHGLQLDLANPPEQQNQQRRRWWFSKWFRRT